MHGDIAPGNILMRDRRLRAHRLRHPRHRRPRLRLRDGMDVFRGGRAPRFPRRAELRHGCPGARGWALWKSLITYDDENPDSRQAARHAVREILGKPADRRAKPPCSLNCCRISPRLYAVRAALPAQPKRCAVPKTANCGKLALPARPKQRAESSISATGLSVHAPYARTSACPAVVVPPK